MKKTLTAIFTLVLLIALAWALVRRDQSQKSAWNRIKNPETVKMLKQFVAMKRAQTDASTNRVPPEIQAMFASAERGDWLTLSNSFHELQERNMYWNSLGYGTRHWHGYRGAVEDFISAASKMVGGHWQPQPPLRLQGTPGAAITEVLGALEAFVVGDEKYSAAFGRDIIDSIPPGSIYFGGTDPGRFIVTAMCQSQPDADPFFTLTQNALADGTYLDYARSMYGKKIYIPTPTDSQDCFQEFVRSKSSGSLGGSTVVSSHVDVMGINGLIAKVVFDQNTNREIFIYESFPLDWMYPQLEPHGLLFKINRLPVEKLSAEILQRDHDFWTNQIRPMIGGWLTDETSVKEIAAFVKKIFGRNDFNGFSGDTSFVQNGYTTAMYSKSRSSIAGLYAWRERNPHDEPEKKRMAREADLAFRQSWALCPYGPEPVYRYVNFLLEQNRFDDAFLIAETAAALPQNKGNEAMLQLAAQLKQQLKEHPPAPAN